MARYEKDYGSEFGWRGQRGSPPSGGMRSDGWDSYWRDFPGEEGWYGGARGGMSRPYDRGFQGEFDQWGNRYGGRGGDEPRGGYGSESRGRGGGYGGRGWETGYGGRETGYQEGWSEAGGWGGERQGQQWGGWKRTRAAEIMTEQPVAVTADATVSEVAQKMRDLDVGIIPVVESDDNRRLRGVITDRDIAVRAVADGKDGNTPVSDCMSQRVRAVNKNDSVQDVMRIMREERVRRVPVTDREGRLVGIIAQADLAVDYAGSDPGRELEVGETIERISEPARPQRGEDRKAASAKGRSRSGGAQG
jgi:CBS domain-containing protein